MEASRSASVSAPTGRLGTGTTLAYGFGTVAYGVKDFAFSTFLLLYYNQVIGLPATQVGFVIMCALVLDAFLDPAIGFLSDRTRGRWGRRHPWMYASAVPIAIAWLLLWNPPELSQGALLVWLFGFAVIVRAAVSAYEVPSQALSAELTTDYDDRTRIMAYRYLFGWAGGLTMLVATYGISWHRSRASRAACSTAMVIGPFPSPARSPWPSPSWFRRAAPIMRSPACPRPIPRRNRWATILPSWSKRCATAPSAS